MDFDTVDSKQAFKLGFAAYCADHGYTAEEAVALSKYAGVVGDTAAVAGNAAPYALALGFGIPAALGLAGGGALGYGAAKFDEPETTPDDIKAQEIADTYKRYTDRLKARRAYQQYRAARGMQ